MGCEPQAKPITAPDREMMGIASLHPSYGPRAADHEYRILANDPAGDVTLKTIK